MSIIEKLFEKDVSKTVKKDNFNEHPGGTSSVDKQNISRSVEPDHGNDKHEKSKNSQINYERLKSFGFLTPDIMNITLAEQYRRIKQPILLNAFHDGIEGLRNGNLVMITSSLSSEGKTFSSFNLAMSVANEFNHSVLYVDADGAHCLRYRAGSFDPPLVEARGPSWFNKILTRPEFVKMRFVVS